MSDHTEKNRLEALEDRLEAAKATKAGSSVAGTKVTMAQQAWRMVIELVVGICLGIGIGIGLDKLLGTTPLLMIIFLGLGFAAGIRTVMRTAAEVQEQNVTLVDTQQGETD